MALTNDQITAQNFKYFYEQIRPYLNGTTPAGFTPVGTVIAVMGKTAPTNYLACDGTVYNITQYPDLANYFEQQFESSNYFGGDGITTFAVPDLRGEFLRGTGTNSHTNQGNGANVGTHQDATEHPGYLLGIDGVWYLPNKTNISTPHKTDVGINTVNGRKYTRITETEEVYEMLETYTSRPTNTSVLYCIAYKNIYIGTSSGGGGSTYTAGNGIDITNDVISTDNMPSADMSEIVTPLPSTVPKKVKYSTEEQIVGEWVDGSPVYQKVVTTSYSFGTATEWITGPTIPNIKYIIDAYGIFHANSSFNHSVYMAYLNTKIAENTDIVLLFQESNVSAQCTTDYLILRYTKTTDQVGE